MAQTYGPTLFGEAAASLGYHPFPHPTGNLSQPYVNPLGAQLGACTYCGFCEKFGCGNYSKASPQTTVLPYLMAKPNFTLKTGCEVLKVELTPDRKRATGVTFVDSAGRTFFQPAELVILSPMCCTTCGCCCSPASASPTIRRRARGRWAATTPTRPCRRSTCSSTTS